MRTVSKSATFLATESVNSAPFKRGKTEVQIFWQGIAQNSSPILRCTFLARRSAKLIANFSATMVTSLPSFSLSLYLSLSLSLSPNVPHTQYRKRFRASYNKRVLQKIETCLARGLHTTCRLCGLWVECNGGPAAGTVVGKSCSFYGQFQYSSLVGTCSTIFS